MCSLCFFGTLIVIFIALSLLCIYYSAKKKPCQLAGYTGCCKKATQSGGSIQAMQPVALRQGVAVAGPSDPDGGN